MAVRTRPNSVEFRARNADREFGARKILAAIDRLLYERDRLRRRAESDLPIHPFMRRDPIRNRDPTPAALP